jgi:hypothetical protein
VEGGLIYMNAKLFYRMMFGDSLTQFLVPFMPEVVEFIKKYGQIVEGEKNETLDRARRIC